MPRATLVFLLAAGLFAGEGTASDEHRAIRGLLSQGKYQDALSAAQALNKRIPDDVAAYEYMAEALLALGKVEQAEKSAQWMLDLKLGKVTPSGSRVIAKIRKHYKDYEGAAEMLALGYRRITTEQENLRIPMLTELGELYRLAGKTEAAAKVEQELKRQAPTPAPAPAPVATKANATQAAIPTPTPATAAPAVAFAAPAGSATKGPSQVNPAAEALQKLRETSDPAFLARAEKLVAQALKANPDDPENRVSEIEIHLHRHEFRKAIELATALGKAHPQDARIPGMLGDAQMETGNYDAAADAYETMLRLKPSLASYNRAAHYRYVTGDLDGAISIMKRAARMGGAYPENTAWCWVETGNLLLKKRDYDEARMSFETALRWFPNYHAALAGLARVTLAKGDAAAAVPLAQKAAQIIPLPEYVGLLYDLYLASGNTAEAAKQWQLLEQIDKLGRAAGELTNRKLALIYADHRKHLDRALDLTTAELAVRQDVFTFDAHAWVLFQNGRAEEARAFMRKALAQKTAEPMFTEHARQILSRSEEAAENTVAALP